MKKRFQLSLTEENVTEFQRLSKKLGFPPNVLSSTVDDYLKQMIPVLRTAIEKDKLTLTDMFKLIADQVELIENEKEVTKDDKKKVTPSSSRKAKS